MTKNTDMLIMGGLLLLGLGGTSIANFFKKSPKTTTPTAAPTPLTTNSSQVLQPTGKLPVDQWDLQLSDEELVETVRQRYDMLSNWYEQDPTSPFMQKVIEMGLF